MNSGTVEQSELWFSGRISVLKVAHDVSTEENETCIKISG